MYNILIKPPCCNTYTDENTKIAKNAAINSKSGINVVKSNRLYQCKPSNLITNKKERTEHYTEIIGDVYDFKYGRVESTRRVIDTTYTGNIMSKENGKIYNITGCINREQNTDRSSHRDYDNYFIIEIPSLGLTLKSQHDIVTLLEQGVYLEDYLSVYKDAIHWSSTEKVQALIQKLPNVNADTLITFEAETKAIQKQLEENKAQSEQNRQLSMNKERFEKLLIECKSEFSFDYNTEYWVHNSGLMLKKLDNQSISLENGKVVRLELNSKQIIVHSTKFCGQPINNWPTYCWIKNNNEYGGAFYLVSDMIDCSAIQVKTVQEYNGEVFYFDELSERGIDNKMLNIEVTSYPLLHTDILKDKLSIKDIQYPTKQGYPIVGILNNSAWKPELMNSKKVTQSYEFRGKVYNTDTILYKCLANSLYNITIHHDRGYTIKEMTDKMYNLIHRFGIDWHIEFAYNKQSDVIYLTSDDFYHDSNFSISLNHKNEHISAEPGSMLYVLNKYIEETTNIPNMIARISFKKYTPHKNVVELWH